MFEQAPDGYFLRDLLIFRGLRHGGFVAKGFIFEPPDLNNAQISELNEFQDQISLLLASLNDHQRLQVQYYCDSDYRAELLRYREETEKATNLWTRRCRNERFTRYWSAMKERRLRRQRVVLYISRAIDAPPRQIISEKALSKFYNLILDQLEAEFTQVHQMLSGIFSGQGARITPMTDADHFRHYKTFLNPSLADRSEENLLDGFEPAFSIQENCWHSEGNGQSDFGFWMDGHYQSVIVLSRWPKVTYPGLIHRLTNLRLLDYTITVNVDPLPVQKEILKEEKEHDRLAGDYASEKKLSLLTVMEKKQRKIAALTQGHTLPFDALVAIRCWDKSKEGLLSKVNVIKSAINAMNGAQYFESAMPTTSKNVFYHTWPGWTWGRNQHRKLYAENRYLADMLPLCATFTGHLESAEAIYDGPGGNLIGVKTFSGDEGNSSPQHAVLLGMSGAGKSVTICDLLSQTEAYFAYTVIIEEGLSYGIYTQTVDPNAKPIIIQPDGNLTLNYLDTKGLPLSADHLSSATALVARMTGVGQDENQRMLRYAQIVKYLRLLYEDVFQDWSKKHPDQILPIARHACALARYRTEKMVPGATCLETFADFREWSERNPDESAGYLRELDEAEVVKFLKDPNTSKAVLDLTFAYLRPEEFPTHRMLQELMYLDAAGPEREEIIEMATLLLPWCRDGSYGALFDGTSNLSLTGKIAHFELGYIPDSARELRSAAGFLITNEARKHIITLPRSLRKRVVYEELARILNIPGGEEIVKESYAQMRKFNTWNISIIQQYAQFKQSRIRSAVFGNSRQFFFMRQNDREDLEDIAKDIALPEVTKQQIMSHPLPDHQVGQKYSAFTYMHLGVNRPVCGTVFNVASPEVLYCSSSSGEHFEKRAKELQKSSNIVEGIIAHAQSASDHHPL